MTDNTKISVRVTPSFLWQLRQFAAEQRTTVTQVVIAAVRDYAMRHGFTFCDDATE